jgi:16S rRNA (cytidine1402-2'-O)-methyltransferase
MEKLVWNSNQTQIFMETPYRNNKMLKVLMATLSPETKLCVATDITGQTQQIKTLPVVNWKDCLPDIQKLPTIYLIGQ